MSKIMENIKELYQEGKQNLSGLIVVTIVVAVVIGWMLLYMDSIRGSLVISLFIIGIVSVFVNPFLGIIGMVWVFFFLSGAWYMSGMSWLQPMLMFTIVSTICWFLRMVVSRSMYIYFPIQTWILIGLFFCMYLSTLCAVYSSEISWGWNIEFLKLIGIFIIFINLTNSPARLNSVYWLIVLSCGYLSLIGCRSFFMEGYNRLETIGEGQLKGSNELASVLAMTVPFLFYKFFSKKRWEKMLSLLIIPITFCIMVSGSRGATVEVALIILLIICYMKLSPKVIASVVILLFIVIAFSPSEYWARMKTIKDSKEESASSRKELMKAGLRMWKDYPIFGVGQDNFRYICLQYCDLSKNNRQRVAHNTYIEILSEGGIIAFLLYLLFIFLLFKELRFVKKHALVEYEEFHIQNMANSLEITLCGFLVECMFSNRAYFVMPFFLFALCTSLKNIVTSKGLLREKERDYA